MVSKEFDHECSENYLYDDFLIGYSKNSAKKKKRLRLSNSKNMRGHWWVKRVCKSSSGDVIRGIEFLLILFIIMGKFH